jgi:signal transduction histidine kinase
MPISSLASILTFLISLSLGIFIIYKDQKSLRNITFGAFTICVSIWVLANFFTDIAQTPQNATFWARMALVTPAFMPFLLLLFSKVFPRQEEPLSKGVWALLSLPALITLALSPTSLNIERVTFTESGQQLFVGPLYTPFFIYFAIYLTGTFINLFRKFRRAAGLERLQIQYLALGVATAAIFALLLNVVLPIFGLSTLVSLGPFSSLFIVGTVSYAIVKHRLLDIEVIIRRSLVYSTLLAVLIGMYSLLVSILNSVFLPGTAAGAFPRVTDLIAIVLVAFTVDPLRRYIEKATDKIFFKARYNAEEIINQLSETLVSEIDLIQLAREIKKVLVENIKVSKVSIFVKSDHRFFPIAAANDFPKQLDTNVEKKHLVTKYLSDHHEILVLEEAERNLKEGKRLHPHLAEATKTLGKIGVEVVVPLVVKGRLNGAMFLGEKLSQDIYSGADLRFLEILSHQAALSLENAKLYEEQKLYGVRLTKEVERATTDLRHANERLKELDELKDEFMSIASHELRTPMTAIKSYVWLALNNKGGEITTKLRNYLTKVYDSSDRMIAMINDMLNVSRIETGRLQLEIVPVSVQKVLDQVTGDLSARSAEAGVEIKVAKDQIIPLVLADREKLAEIFTNLIGNALKFTRKDGKVTISAQKVGSMLEVSVTDTGIGIAKENIPKLFKKYGRIGESYATMTPSTGTGLGLYITKQYLEKMHGNIRIKSTLGKGTTFSFSLPIATGVTKETEEKKEVVPFVPKSILR